MDSTVESSNQIADDSRNISNGLSSKSLFLKKFSIFDAKVAQPAIESIVEVAEGFNNEQEDFEESLVRQSSKTKAVEEADAQLQSLSISGDKYVCTTCNFQFADREEQVSHRN